MRGYADREGNALLMGGIIEPCFSYCQVRCSSASERRCRSLRQPRRPLPDRRDRTASLTAGGACRVPAGPTNDPTASPAPTPVAETAATRESGAATSLRPVDARHTAGGRSTRRRAGVGRRRATLRASQFVAKDDGLHPVQESGKRSLVDRLAGRYERRLFPRRPGRLSRRSAKETARAVLGGHRSTQLVCGTRAPQKWSSARSRCARPGAQLARLVTASTLIAREQALSN